jgi:hypothetical protein
VESKVLGLPIKGRPSLLHGLHGLHGLIERLTRTRSIIPRANLPSGNPSAASGLAYETMQTMQTMRIKKPERSS